MFKTKEKIFAMLIVVLMIVPVAALTMPTAQATTVNEVQTTNPNTEGFPDLPTSPPSGVTPDYEFDTVAYLSFRPNPIGVGQSLLVNVWLSPGTYHAFPMMGMIVDIIKPDGTTMTVGPFNSYVGDSTAWFEMIPDQAGTWQLKFTFEGTYIAAGQYWDAPGSETGGFIASGKYYNLGASIYYKPEETEWQNLTVTDDMVSSWPYRSLTTDYWTRPINPMWRDWGASIGDYPFTSAYYYADGSIQYPDSITKYKFVAYVTAPNSAHVLWKRTLDTTGPAGMTGGYTWDYSLAPNAGTPAIVYAGRCYQSITKDFENGSIGTVLQCYDLKTGYVYWERAYTGAAPTIIEYQAPGIPAPGGGAATVARDTAADQGWSINLIGFSAGSANSTTGAVITPTTMYKYNPATGAQTAVRLTPLSAAPTYCMPGYALAVQDMGSSYAAAERYRLINFSTYGTTSDFTARIASNITWPCSSIYGGSAVISGGGGAFDYENGLVASVGWNTPPGPQWGIGTEVYVTDLKTGSVLWHWQTNNTVTENIQSTSSPIWWHGKLAFNAHGRSWVCFDGRTGAKLWTSDQTEYPWGSWWPYSTAAYPYNETTCAIITGTYEGVYAINFADGKILWHYSTEPFAVPFEGPYNAEPFFTAVTLADGKVYAYNGEHTASFPRDRAWSTYCIDAYTGELIWKIHNPMTPGAIADGCLTAANSYDGNMYVFGKGMSATTVSGPEVTIPKGDAVLIKGTVMDMSPAQPNTPCVSKDSMGLQMEVIHMQMPQTGLWGNETLTGVPVTLTAIGSDGSVIDIGSTTTNGYYGTFGLAWTPPTEDTYTIMASFAGDDSYGSSSAATTVNVGPAATPVPTVEPSVQTDYMPTLTGILVGVVVAIIVSIIALAVVLRKHA